MTVGNTILNRTRLSDSTGNELTLEPNGSLPVTIQDQTTPVFIIPFSQEVNTTTITADTAVDDYSVTIADTTGFVDGRMVTLLSVPDARYYWAYQVGAPVGNVINLDRPIDHTFKIGGQAGSSITNMNVDGSGTTQVFRVRVGEPAAGIDVTIDITRIIITIYTDTAVSLDAFGDIAGGLTYGVTLRRVDGTIQNIFNVKSNGDIANIAFDLNEYASTNPQQGQDGIAARLTFSGQSKMGVVLRIGPHEDLQLLVNDDITSLGTFKIMAEGSLAIV